MKRTVTLGFLLAVSMLLAYVESLIPFGIGIPGIKLGLPNLVVVLMMYIYNDKEALLVNLVRIVLSGFLFSNLYTILYSLAGALCSFAIMFLLKKTKKFSIIGISISGGVFHNVGQLLVAMIVVDKHAKFAFILYMWYNDFWYTDRINNWYCWQTIDALYCTTGGKKCTLISKER